MKKIILILIMMIINIGLVKAENEFYMVENTDGVYANFIEGNFTKKEDYRTIYRSSDDKLMYSTSLTRWENDVNNYNFNQIEIDDYDNTYYDEETTNRLKNIMYFGYGYQNHTTDNYLMATQTMIWDLLSYGTISYFNMFYGDVKLFKNEIKEINKLIDDHTKQISFCNMDIETEENVLILNDNNNVIKNYQVISSNAKIIDNSLVIDTSNKDKIILEEKLEIIPKDYFYHGDVYNLVSRTNIPKNVCELNVKKIDNKVTIINETNEEILASINDSKEKKLTEINLTKNDTLKITGVVKLEKETDNKVINEKINKTDNEDKIILENVPNTSFSLVENYYYIDEKKNYSINIYYCVK